MLFLALDKGCLMKKIKEQQGFSGQGLIEYAIVLGLVALITVGGLALTGGDTKNVYEKAAELFSGATPIPIADDLYPKDRITIKVVDQTGQGISDARVYCFQSTGAYLNKQGTTNASGLVEFMDMPEGSYKFRADVQGQMFWSSVISYPESYFATIRVPKTEFSVKVVDVADRGIGNVQIYTYTTSGGYAGVSGKTGSDGVVKLDMVDGAFKFRAVSQAQDYWTPIIAIPTVLETTIKTGQDDFALKVVDQAGNGISNVKVYAYNTDGSYAGVYERTGADGVATMQIGDGSFKFKAVHHAHDFWSDIVVLPGIRSATIRTEQQPFSVTVVDASGVGIGDVLVYAYNTADQYTGAYGRTNGSGVLSLDLAIGVYKFKAVHQAQDFWSGAVSFPETLSTLINTGQQNITLTVLNVDRVPINNAPVYVYSTTGAYAGTWGRTNPEGRVVLGFSAGSFRVRVSTGGQDYWSDIISMPGSTNIEIIAK